MEFRRRATIAIASLLMSGAMAVAFAADNQPPVVPIAGPPVEPVKPRARPAQLITPAQVIDWAAADALTLPEEERYGTRYLSIYNDYPEVRATSSYYQNFAVNSLSRRKILTPLTVVPGTGGTLLRVRLASYSIDPAAWDDLGRTGSGPVVHSAKIDVPEPYFHVTIQGGAKAGAAASKVTVIDGKKWREVPTAQYTKDGKTYNSKYVEVEETASAVNGTLEHAPWLPAPPIAALATALHSDFPVYRGDWFFANALINPGYNRLLGFKKLADAIKVGRFRAEDEDLATRGVVTISNEVAQNIRAAQYYPTSTGYWWETFDYKTSIGGDDLLVNLLNRRRDASELIFTLPNQLQAYLLLNDKEELLDVGDPNIVSDTRTSWRNKQVWSAVSCIGCHDQGIKNIRDDVRLLANNQVGLLVKDKKDFERTIDLFGTPIEEPVNRGQAMYTRAIGIIAGGMTPRQLAAGTSERFVRYVQAELTIEDLAMETGHTPEQIKAVLGRALNPDHTLTQLLQGRPVRRDQIEAKGFAQLMILLGDGAK